jgi:hypothetical protein
MWLRAFNADLFVGLAQCSFNMRFSFVKASAREGNLSSMTAECLAANSKQDFNGMIAVLDDGYENGARPSPCWCDR